MTEIDEANQGNVVILTWKFSLYMFPEARSEMGPENPAHSYYMGLSVIIRKAGKAIAESGPFFKGIIISPIYPFLQVNGQTLV